MSVSLHARCLLVSVLLLCPAVVVADESDSNAKSASAKVTTSHLPGGAGEEKILEALNSETEVDFVETPLDQVVEFLADFHKVPIILDRRALEEGGLDPSATPVTRQLKGISLRSALRLIFAEHNLAYLVENEVLQVTTKQSANSRRITRVYPVNDLLKKFGDSFNAAQLAQVVASAVSNESAADAAGGSGGSPMGASGMASPEGGMMMSSMPDMSVYGGSGMSMTPGTAYGSGMYGGMGSGASSARSIHFVPGALIITHSWPAHEGISQLLGDLRRLDAPPGEKRAKEEVKTAGPAQP